MKCKVCGKRFTPKAEKRYLVTKKRSALEALSGGENVFDCFDCPRCGCQIVAKQRCEKVADFVIIGAKKEQKEIEGE